MNAVPTLELPAIDPEALLEEDANAAEQLENDVEIEKPEPLRYAVPVSVSAKPETHGKWESMPDGAAIWRYRVSCPGATDLNLAFTQYQLPRGATLHIISEEQGDYYEGPYTDRDNKPNGQLWLPLVPGDTAVIQLYLPANTKAKLELSHVGCGYRNLFSDRPNLRGPRQGDCNIDVACQEAGPWRDQINSVALCSISGSRACTGQMLADAPKSFRPFFLTAEHCGVDANNAQSVTVYWNFESPNCGDLGGGSLADNQTGARFLASRRDVDFALVELNNIPDSSLGVFYGGWDRSNVAPEGSVGIHHPAASEKAISFSDEPPTTIANCTDIAGAPSTHWGVEWSRGTTERGSSGSGVWNTNNQKLIGFLSGGLASCSNPSGTDCYGKLATAWDGDDSSSRLRDHLDPDNTGAMTVDGAYFPGVTIRQTTNPSQVQAGGLLEHVLRVGNGPVRIPTGVTVSVDVPTDTTYVSGSATCGGSENDGTLTFPLGTLANRETAVCTFQVEVSRNLSTQILFEDDMENGAGKWTVSHGEGPNDWTLGSTNPHSGSFAWSAEGVDGQATDQYLTMTNPVLLSGEMPGLRVLHRLINNDYIALDGGVIEISTDGDVTWMDMGPNIRQNGYNYEIVGLAGTALVGRRAFTLPHPGAHSYIETIVNMENYKGRSVLIRFRMATTNFNHPAEGSQRGVWYVDDVEILDQKTITSEACVSADGGDNPACSTAKTLVLWTAPPTHQGCPDTSNVTTPEETIYPNRLYWSNDGRKVDGLICETRIIEPWDCSDGWGDNFICYASNSPVAGKLSWTYGYYYYQENYDEYIWTDVDEDEDPAGWHNNSIGVKKPAPLELEWHSKFTDEIRQRKEQDGFRCLHFNEPNEKHQQIWADNYLCYKFLEKFDNYTLTVQVTGDGTVTFDGQNCTTAGGAGCSHSYPEGTNVLLTAVPDAGKNFLGWSRACRKTGVNKARALVNRANVRCVARFGS